MIDQACEHGHIHCDICSDRAVQSDLEVGLALVESAPNHKFVTSEEQLLAEGWSKPDPTECGVLEKMLKGRIYAKQTGDGWEEVVFWVDGGIASRRGLVNALFVDGKLEHLYFRD